MSGAALLGSTPFFNQWTVACDMALSSKLKALKHQMRTDHRQLSLSLEGFIRKHVADLERSGTILGLSGGIDSAVVATLCQRAVGSDRTSALIMPDRDSNEEHGRDALLVARELGIEARSIDITPHLERLGVYELFMLNRIPLPKRLKENLVRAVYGLYEKKTGETAFSAGMLGFKGKSLGSCLRRSSAYYRTKHRLRMVLLYLHGEMENRLVVGAVNRTEYEIGFFVKHGCDDAADIMPLLALYKTQVRELARYLNVPLRIIDKAPSPDLIPGLMDEQVIGIPYDKLDLILFALKGGLKDEEISKAVGIEETKVSYVRGLGEKSGHMREVYVSDQNPLKPQD